MPYVQGILVRQGNPDLGLVVANSGGICVRRRFDVAGELAAKRRSVIQHTVRVSNELAGVAERRCDRSGRPRNVHERHTFPLAVLRTLEHMNPEREVVSAIRAVRKEGPAAVTPRSLYRTRHLFTAGRRVTDQSTRNDCHDGTHDQPRERAETTRLHGRSTNSLSHRSRRDQPSSDRSSGIPTCVPMLRPCAPSAGSTGLHHGTQIARAGAISPARAGRWCQRLALARNVATM